MAASAYFCGSRTHTSMSASLTSRSTSRWCDTSVESWSGRSRSTTPRSCSSSRPLESIESRVTWWRAGMPSHSRSSSAPSRPQTQAVAHEVVGRRTPTAESSSSVSALKVDDLPEPVAPASATTVCSADSLRRLAARSTTPCASSRIASSTRPRAASTACSRPCTRAPMSELRETSFLAPSSKDDMFSLDGCRMDRGPTLCVRGRVGRLRTLLGGLGCARPARSEAQVVDTA